MKNNIFIKMNESINFPYHNNDYMVIPDYFNKDNNRLNGNNTSRFKNNKNIEPHSSYQNSNTVNNMENNNFIIVNKRGEILIQKDNNQNFKEINCLKKDGQDETNENNNLIQFNYNEKKNYRNYVTNNLNYLTNNNNLLKNKCNISNYLKKNISENTGNINNNDNYIIHTEDNAYYDLNRTNNKKNMNQKFSDDKVKNIFENNNDFQEFNHFNNSNDIYNNNCNNLNSNILKINNSNFDLIKTMAVLESSNKISWMNNFKSFAFSLYYGVNFAEKMDKKSPNLPLFLFGKKINQIIQDEINIPLNQFLYMSYRSGFNNLSRLNCGDFSSDCGWGCMLRCCQMLLSHGLIKKKINDKFKKNNKINLECLQEIRKETLLLFHDCYLPIEQVRELPDYNTFFEIYQNLAETDSRYKAISEIIPPYSIHILCKLGKCAGEYTSDIRMVKTFIDINKQIFNNLQMIHFECGYLSKKTILDHFCEPFIHLNQNEEKIYSVFSYNGIDYIFKKEGLIFISFRLGLHDLDKSFYDIIPLLFSKIHNNLGFVSGKKNRAFYFIGINRDNKLIFVDPHFNQQAIDIYQKDCNLTSYFTPELYLMDIRELSSELTLGIGIYNSKQLSLVLEDLTWFSNNYPDFISIK